MPNSKCCLNCNPFKPCKCKGILDLFRCKPISRVFKYLHRNAERRRRSNRKFRSIHAVFWPLMSIRSDERDRIGEAPTTTGTEVVEIETQLDQTVTFQVQPVLVNLDPVTPTVTSAYIKIAQRVVEIASDDIEEINEVQKACRSFEKYLTEMLVDERKIRDLLDVEELMYCMSSLKSPAFVELVCTFYGELCMDLFSNINNGDEIEC